MFEYMVDALQSATASTGESLFNVLFSLGELGIELDGNLVQWLVYKSNYHSNV